MAEHSGQDLRYATELREEVHREALAIARETVPWVTEVIDAHPVEDYFQEMWDYPGRWYTVVAIPYGYKHRGELIDEIVRDTLSAIDPFYAEIAGHPELVIDYFIIKNEQADAGYEAHCRALKAAFDKISEDWDGDPGRAVGQKITVEELFSKEMQGKKLNYRRAFMRPPHFTGFTGKDFDRANAALFPNGTEGLEVYEWTTDWSDYFDDGREWWGTLCLTVYDPTLDRFVVIMASATD